MARALIITVEGVNTSLIGAYGSNTAVTPSLDRLASEGVLLDQCFADSLDPLRQLRSLWSGQHALQNREEGPKADADCPAGGGIWAALGVNKTPCVFLTDCSAAAKSAEEAGCAEVVLIEPPDSESAVEAIEDASIMALFVAASELLAGELQRQSTEDTADEPAQLYWVHSRGLRLPWDAPLSLRREFADEEDPDPPEEVGPPALQVSDDTDPDLVVGWGQVAAAQVSVLDEAVGTLLGVLEVLPDREGWATAWISLGGVPLGEHGTVGWREPQLFGEQLQVAAILQPTPRLEIGCRYTELTQLPDLGVTIADWLEVNLLAGKRPPAASSEAGVKLWGNNVLQLSSIAAPDGWPPEHQLACAFEGAGKWVRSPAWSCTITEAGDTALFVKPDDRWEINDVASLRADVVEQLLSEAEHFLQAARHGDRAMLHQLSEDLCNLIR